MMQKFDLIVIGSGSGLDVANAAVQSGLKVAVVERGKMGGTCLNRGCIPSKLLLHSADVAETIKNAETFGIKIEGFSINFEKIVERVNGIIDPDSENIKNAFKYVTNPKLFQVECKFIGQKVIQVGEETITADKILISCGSRPLIPKIKGLEGTGFITSDEALRLKKQPRVLTILGGGYIATELAHFFGALGTKVNIVQRRDALLPKEDEEISQKFTEVFARKYGVYTGYQTIEVFKKDGKYHLIAKNKEEKSIELVSDELLVAVGRIPNTDTLDLEKTGVKVNEKGYIITDEYLETTAKGIFALGDAVGKYQFKHSANHEAQYAYTNIVRPEHRVPVDYTAMPHAIFSSPQVAGVGLTEQELKKNGMDYQKSVYSYIDTAMGEALEDKDGFVKFLVERETRKILGCHIIGTDASILIHEVLVPMRSGEGTIDSITQTITIHPSLSEVVARAADALR
ncbi:MAG: dihydrolipoyl dehydrogenase family protein [Nitrosotalea sp.]